MISVGLLTKRLVVESETAQRNL